MAQKDEEDEFQEKLMHDTMVRAFLDRSGIDDKIESMVKESTLAHVKCSEPKPEPPQELYPTPVSNDKHHQQQQHEQRYPLHHALRNGDFGVSQQLLEQGSDACLLDPELKSPLHCAVYACASYRYENHAIPSSLWDALILPATITQKDSSQKFPIDIAASMKTKPLPFPVLRKLMHPANMSCFTMVKLTAVVDSNDFLNLVEFALTLLRPKDLKFTDWKAFLFDNLDEVYANYCSQVTSLNRMLLRRCVDSERNIDQGKIRRLMTLLWTCGCSNVTTLTENSMLFSGESAGNQEGGSETEEQASQRTFQKLMRNARSLTDLCRITVRNHIRDLSEDSFDELKLPPCLISYLTFSKLT